MFSTQNVVDVTKAAIAQLTAKGYMDVENGDVKELNDQFIVDLGEKLSIEDGQVTNGTPADIFFKALLSQIGKVVIDSRSYVAQLPKLFVDPISFGLMSEVIKIDLSDVLIDEAWNPNGFINWNEDGGPEEGARIAAIEFGCYKPAVKAKLYKKVTGIMVALTTAREQLFTAFTGLDQYNAFIAGLFNSVENTIQLKAEVYGLMTVSMGIAKARANDNEINLLTEYKAIHTDSTLTASNAFEDEDFMRFALMRIAETKDNIQRYTALYNDHESVTFSSNPNVILLNKFANAAKFGVRANTFNEQLLGIGDYDKVVSWQAATSDQGVNDKYSFATASQISLSDAAAEDAGLTPDKKNIKGVIGVIYDPMSMFVSIQKDAVSSQPSASRMTTNFFFHSLINRCVNDSYAIVTFTVADPEE